MSLTKSAEWVTTTKHERFVCDPHAPDFPAGLVSTDRRLRGEFRVLHHPEHDFFFVAPASTTALDRRQAECPCPT